MKKPKSEWQLAVKYEMEKRGMTCEDLADAVDTKSGYIRQLMCGTYSWVSEDSPVKMRITEYLGIEL